MPFLERFLLAFRSRPSRPLGSVAQQQSAGKGAKEAEMARLMEALRRETTSSKKELVQLAMSLGLRYLWRAWVLGQYRKGLIARTEAVAEVGAEWVEFSERHPEVLPADLGWALEPD